MSLSKWAKYCLIKFYVEMLVEFNEVLCMFIKGCEKQVNWETSEP